ncbi:hypothetical protein FB45DRAFT_861786 [Roridomyces roridus]|uniref:KOW domain-containing protein n=1 Tax=Roridomyces roridus TaxID=1738132 RepID=A0AAD7CC33_9AGAR|nr:hypothetical protein FB45DRAFT_861786 [Roridomyces roridus]
MEQELEGREPGVRATSVSPPHLPSGDKYSRRLFHQQHLQKYGTNVPSPDKHRNLVHQGEWVRLEPDPCVIGHLLDSEAKRFLVKSIHLPAHNRPLVQIRTRCKARTRKNTPIVHPTEEELVPFRMSNHRLLQKLNWGQTSFALGKEDWVFVVSGAARKRSGVIKHIEKNKDRAYVIVPLDWPSPYPLLSKVRRHLLDPGPIPHLGDRVLVVHSLNQDEYGLIREINGHKITIECGEYGSNQDELARIREEHSTVPRSLAEVLTAPQMVDEPTIAVPRRLVKVEIRFFLLGDEVEYLFEHLKWCIF